jgi:predicted lactoylglutathione lyase
MAAQIFVNLPVKDLQRSVAFFTSLGYGFDPRFSDENATCMIVSDTICVMLLLDDFFKTFTKKDLCDTARHTEVLVGLSCDSREKVDEMVDKAVAAGGLVPNVARDYGFMYQHGFEDLDGHLWELIYLAPEASPQGA